MEVPGNSPRFDEIQPVPHGALQIRTYTSTPLKKLRQCPILIVMPNGDTDATWGVGSSPEGIATVDHYRAGP